MVCRICLVPRGLVIGSFVHFNFVVAYHLPAGQRDQFTVRACPDKPREGVKADTARRVTVNKTITQRHHG